MAARILGLVRSCKECPRRSYYSGGQYRCAEIDEPLPESEWAGIPRWCPLPVYPSPSAPQEH